MLDAHTGTTRAGVVIKDVQLLDHRRRPSEHLDASAIGIKESRLFQTETREFRLDFRFLAFSHKSICTSQPESADARRTGNSVSKVQYVVDDCRITLLSC